jgi:deferrochelatase/peroxidase EfeB
MLRRGIPYGPLTQNDEKAGGVSQHERGLLFVSYQSSITNGFRTVQKGLLIHHLPTKSC